MCTITVCAVAATRPSATDTIRSSSVRLDVPTPVSRTSTSTWSSSCVSPDTKSISIRRITTRCTVSPSEVGEVLVAGLLQVRQIGGVVNVAESVHITPPDLDAFNGHARPVSHVARICCSPWSSSSGRGVRGHQAAAARRPGGARHRAWPLPDRGAGVRRRPGRDPRAARASAGAISPRLVAAGLLVVVVYHLSLNAGERLTTAGTASVVVAVGAGDDAGDGARASDRSASRAGARSASRSRSQAWSWSSCSARGSGSRSTTPAGRCSCSPRRSPSPPTT